MEVYPCRLYPNGIFTFPDKTFIANSVTILLFNKVASLQITAETGSIYGNVLAKYDPAMIYLSSGNLL